MAVSAAGLATAQAGGPFPFDDVDDFDGKTYSILGYSAVSGLPDRKLKAQTQGASGTHAEMLVVQAGPAADKPTQYTVVDTDAELEGQYFLRNDGEYDRLLFEAPVNGVKKLAVDAINDQVWQNATYGAAARPFALPTSGNAITATVATLQADLDSAAVGDRVVLPAGSIDIGLVTINVPGVALVPPSIGATTLIGNSAVFLAATGASMQGLICDGIVSQDARTFRITNAARDCKFLGNTFNNTGRIWIDFGCHDYELADNTGTYTTGGAFYSQAGPNNINYLEKPIAKRGLVHFNTIKDSVTDLNIMATSAIVIPYAGEPDPAGANAGYIEGDQWAYYSSTIIERNLFINCTGDAELVSIKSRGNIIRNNFARDCNNGHYSARSISHNYIYGNVALAGAGYAVNIRAEDTGFFFNFFEDVNNMFRGSHGWDDVIPLPNIARAVQVTRRNRVEANVFVRKAGVFRYVDIDGDITLANETMHAPEEIPSDNIVKNNIILGDGTEPDPVYRQSPTWTGTLHDEAAWIANNPEATIDDQLQLTLDANNCSESTDMLHILTSPVTLNDALENGEDLRIDPSEIIWMQKALTGIKSEHGTSIEMRASLRPWTPADIKTELWLDAMDASTIDADGSNVITEWRDKSGNDYHMSSPIGATYAVDANFDATNPGVNTTAASLLGATPFITHEGLITVMGYKDGVDATFDTWASIYGTPDNSSRIIGDSADSFLLLSGTAATNESYINGANAASNVVLPMPTSIQRFEFAQRAGVLEVLHTTANAGRGWLGITYEYIIPAHGTCTDDLLRLEGYLAHKWGLTLPAGHIYEAASPQVST